MPFVFLITVDSDALATSSPFAVRWFAQGGYADELAAGKVVKTSPLGRFMKPGIAGRDQAIIGWLRYE